MSQCTTTADEDQTTIHTAVLPTDTIEQATKSQTHCYPGDVQSRTKPPFALLSWRHQAKDQTANHTVNATYSKQS